MLCLQTFSYLFLYYGSWCLKTKKMVLYLLFHFSPPLNRLFKVSSLKTKPDIFSEVFQIDFLKSLGQCFFAVVCMNHLGALFKKQMLILYGWGSGFLICSCSQSTLRRKTPGLISASLGVLGRGLLELQDGRLLPRIPHSCITSFTWLDRIKPNERVSLKMWWCGVPGDLGPTIKDTSVFSSFLEGRNIQRSRRHNSHSAKLPKVMTWMLGPRASRGSRREGGFNLSGGENPKEAQSYTDTPISWSSQVYSGNWVEVVSKAWGMEMGS